MARAGGGRVSEGCRYSCVAVASCSFRSSRQAFTCSHDGSSRLPQPACPTPFSKPAPLAPEATICHEVENEKCRRLTFTKCLASFQDSRPALTRGRIFEQRLPPGLRGQSSGQLHSLAGKAEYHDLVFRPSSNAEDERGQHEGFFQNVAAGSHASPHVAQAASGARLSRPAAAPQPPQGRGSPAKTKPAATGGRPTPPAPSPAPGGSTAQQPQASGSLALQSLGHTRTPPSSSKSPPVRITTSQPRSSTTMLIHPSLTSWLVSLVKAQACLLILCGVCASAGESAPPQQLTTEQLKDLLLPPVGWKFDREVLRAHFWMTQAAGDDLPGEQRCFTVYPFWPAFFELWVEEGHVKQSSPGWYAGELGELLSDALESPDPAIQKKAALWLRQNLLLYFAGFRLSRIDGQRPYAPWIKPKDA